MKVNPSVKPICDKCKVIRRHGRVMVICENLRRYFAGGNLFNLVDKRLGFPHPSVLFVSGKRGPLA